jgi:hypothetical protein
LKLVKRYEDEMDPVLQMGIHEPPPMILDDISRFDGTAGYDNRPDFVREDDEEWLKS